MGMLLVEENSVDAVAPACVVQRDALVVENTQIAERTFKLTLGDTGLSRSIVPGQFVMVRPSGSLDPLLGRPFALYSTQESSAGVEPTISLVYTVVGRGTECLSRSRPGDSLRIWGPMGNGFGTPVLGEVVFVAGGIGQTPFLTLGQWWQAGASFGGVRFPAGGTQVRLLYGVRSASLLAGLDDFEAAGIPVEVATDDGSAGYHGPVTDLLAQRVQQGLRPAKVIGCGPTPMLRALCRLLETHRIEGDLSLENHMACGFGACFSCVTPIRQVDGTVDLRRVCVEGPIFPASTVVWN